MVDNGNLTWDGVRSYAYDHANRLTQVVSGTLTTQYAYNGDGACPERKRRICKVVGGAPTEYLVDLVATLPVVISDTEAVYIYGLDIIVQQQAERYYYAHDGLGSVRQLTDESGEIVETYAYDPFGVPLEGDRVYNPYRFTGEAWDGEVELLYLRARYYHPATGRFVTRDPWPGDVWRPATFNAYVYTEGNPVNRVDPTGLQCMGPDCWHPSTVTTPTGGPATPPVPPVPTATRMPPAAAPTGTPAITACDDPVQWSTGRPAWLATPPCVSL